MGNGARLQLLLACLAMGPSLQLMQCVTGRVGVVVLGNLGQYSAMQAIVTGVQQAPGLKFGVCVLSLQAGLGHDLLPSH